MSQRPSRRGPREDLPSPSLRALTTRVLAVLLFWSGAAALGLEVLWIRDFALWYGGTAAAAAVVLSVYFAGLALGARIGAGLAERRPALEVYALLEGSVATAVALYVLLRPWLPLAAAWVTRSAPGILVPLARTGLAAAVLLVPTTLLGATVPAVATAARDLSAAGRLYGWNTLGGAVGALATSFAVLPALGARSAFLVVAGVDLAIAAAALMAARRIPGAAIEGPVAPARVAGRVTRPRTAATVAALAGAVALAAEVLWTRGLSGVLSSSVYSVALVLAATLCGIATGTAGAVRVLARLQTPNVRLQPWLAGAAALGAGAVLASTLALRVLPAASLALARSLGATTAPAGLAVEAILALHVVFVPSAAIGALLPLCLGLGDPARPGRALAGPLAANTAGGVAGALVGAFVLLPGLGLGGGLLVLAAVLAGLGAALATRIASLFLATGAAALATTAVVAPPLPFPWRASPDERVVLRRDGPTATVLVTEDARGARRLRINGQYSLGGGDGLFLERREGLLPVLLHPAPRRLLHLGVGTGDTLGAAMTSPGLTADGVELVSSALDAAAFFSNQNGDVLHQPRVHLVADDARSFLLSSRERWDVIVVDLVLPWTQGAGALFSRDFYRLGLEHLAAGGVLCQWLPLHQLQVGDLEAIVSTFTAVFPHVQLWVAYHRSLTPLAALIGSASPIAVDADAMRARLRDPVFLAMARGVGLDDPDDLGMLYVTDGDRLRTVVRDAPWITDDRPRIEFSAPRGFFHQEGLGREALAWVAARLDPAPAPIAGAPPATFAVRADLLRAQLALLAGDGPAELRAYLDALAAAPASGTVRAALAAIAAERLRAGDAATADGIASVLDRSSTASR
jgi:spermidine synthase